MWVVSQVTSIVIVDIKKENYDSERETRRAKESETDRLTAS